MVNITLRPLYLRRKNPGTLRTGGWVSPRTDMDNLEGQSLAIAAIRTPDIPVRRLVAMRTIPASKFKDTVETHTFQC